VISQQSLQDYWFSVELMVQSSMQFSSHFAVSTLLALIILDSLCSREISRIKLLLMISPSLDGRPTHLFAMHQGSLTSCMNKHEKPRTDISPVAYHFRNQALALSRFKIIK